MQGATALHIACQVTSKYSFDMVQLLKARGAPLLFDVNSACKVISTLCSASNIVFSNLPA